MAQNTTSPGKPAPKLPAPPKHLEDRQKDLWRQLVAEYDFADAGSLALLETAMEAHQRARRCRIEIERDSETVKGPFRSGQAASAARRRARRPRRLQQRDEGADPPQYRLGIPFVLVSAWEAAYYTGAAVDVTGLSHAREVAADARHCFRV